MIVLSIDNQTGFSSDDDEDDDNDDGCGLCSIVVVVSTTMLLGFSSVCVCVQKCVSMVF
jgi:hypothetical protein